MEPNESGFEQQHRAERDRGLIEDYRAGRAEAFEELLRAYEPAVRRVLAQLGAAPSDADDLTQEAFLRVYRNLHRFRGQSSFYTWLYRITLNVFFDHAKKRKRADARMERMRNAVADLSNAGGDAHDPFRAAFERLTTERFERAVATLPESFRDVVALRELDELSYEEIALETGISVGTVRSRLSRARGRLRALLAPALGAEMAA
ncbi:MAG TPA: sigma-70 family RNA polymerase sigma factor [Candidatus Elarobacter sp.]|nr:sigma-70 family RNA polymerase sigma factor [Candidatus Elarobacter sp.]